MNEDSKMGGARIMQDMDEYYMRMALDLAKNAAQAEDTPIGAVIVYQDQIIGSGYNKRNAMGDPLCHAEIEAIHQAAQYMGDWRLEETTMYVTLEPCPMCAGAIIQARIPRVVIGAMNPKAGCAGSVLNLLRHPGFNHQADVVTGILQEESRQLMKSFFTRLRERERAEKQGGEPDGEV